MDIIIKLKDCNVVKIDSEMKNEVNRDYCWNGEYSEIVETDHVYEYITFTLDKEDRNVVKIQLDRSGENTTSFIEIVEFFYNKDFSNVSANEFINDFCKHVDGCVYNLEDVGTYYGGWFEYVRKK